MKRRGFTIIEVLTVTLVVGLLMAMIAGGFQRYMDGARRQEAIVMVGTISDALRKWDRTKGSLPATLAEAGYGDVTDPWGNAYQYVNLLTASGNGVARKDKKLAPLNSDFDLYSMGADGITAASLGNSASRDDIVRARDGGFIGLAEDFDP
jgi:general secretion pathway protein G